MVKLSSSYNGWIFVGIRETPQNIFTCVAIIAGYRRTSIFITGFTSTYIRIANGVVEKPVRCIWGDCSGN